MQNLVNHLVKPIVRHPDDVSVNTIEGEASIVLELTVHPDDRALFLADDERTLRSIRMLLSAAAGKRKATIELTGGSGRSDDTDEGEDLDLDDDDTSDHGDDTDSGDAPSED